MQSPTTQFQSNLRPQDFNTDPGDQPLLLPIVEDGALTEEEFYQSRIQVITDLVESRGLSVNSEVSELDILQILDDIGSAPFDRDIAEQLFEKIPQDGVRYQDDHMIFRIRHFIDTYIKAEYLLILQIKETHKEILQTNDEIKQAQESLDTSLRNEVLNQYNLSINSSLYMNIIEAISDSKGFTGNPDAAYTVSAICNKYKYESDEARVKPNDLFNPKFNWDFHIKMETGEEKIVIALKENDYSNRANPVLKTWKATFGVQNYLDQAEHDTWLKLYDDKNNYTKFQLHCIIQFRFSDAKFYQDTIRSLSEIRDKHLENKSVLETSLLSLVAPFIPQGPENNENAAYSMARDSYR